MSGNGDGGRAAAVGRGAGRLQLSGVSPRDDGGSSRLLLLNFNQLYKVSEAAAALWCGVLVASPRSAMWLLRQPADGEPHLRVELAACGVSSRRVEFASLEPDVAIHLARTARAQLVLDTIEYNCHTTGSDALWAGVPILTVPGEQMAARVGGSLLRAVGAPQGRVFSAREYQAAGRLLVAAQECAWHAASR